MSHAEDLSTPTSEPSGANREELRALVRSGVRWKVVSGVVVQAMRIVTAVLIARLVSPADFGVAALVLVFSGLAFIVTDLAMGSALVQRVTISATDCSTVFWTSAGVGLILTVVFVALSWPIARFYGEPQVQPLLSIFSVIFLLNGLSTTQAALLRRDLRFRSLELRAIIATLGSAPVGIATAALGAGAWAIILMSIASSSISLALLWVASPWRPQLIFSSASMRDLGAFGIRVLGARLAWFANNTVDTILIGRFLGPAAVGAYSIGFNLTSFPINRIVVPIRDITFPAFSRVQGDRKTIANGWLRATSFAAFLVAPAMLGMIVVAPTFIPVVLGERWTDAVPVVQALSWVALLFTYQQVGGGSVLLALDRAGTALRFTVFTSVANITAFVAGLPWGITGVAVAYAAVTTVLTPIFTLIVARAVGSSLREYGRHAAPPLLLAGIMAVCVLAAQLLIPDSVVAGAGRLIFLMVLGAVVYFTLCLCFLRGPLVEFRALVFSRRPARN